MLGNIWQVFQGEGDQGAEEEELGMPGFSNSNFGEISLS